MKGRLSRLLALAAFVSAAAVDARLPRLAVSPTGAAPAVAEGVSRLGKGAFLYRPAGMDTQPAPLLLLLHGAGMSPRQMLDPMIPEAERCGCLLLAVAARGATWDLIGEARKARSAGGRARVESLFGADADTIEQILSELLASPVVDRRRIVLVGFSDGATYALSLGLANPGLVRGVVAVAPGFHIEPSVIAPSQRLFVAHSPEDRVLSFENSRDGIFASLQRAGLAARFHSYRGGHSIDLPTVAIGVDYVLDAGR